MEMETAKRIAAALKGAKKAVLFTHVRPDGDAVGSTLALSAALDKLGVENVVCKDTEIPSNLTFLQGLEKFQETLPSDADVFVALDCASTQRLGEWETAFLQFSKKGLTINVDHHIMNNRFARLNWVRECAANCLNVATLIEYMGVPLDKKIATYLMVGLLTDSGNFSHDDVDEETFSLAAKLVAAGADMKDLTENLFKKQSKARAGLYAQTMSGMRYAHQDRFAAIHISQENMKKYGADKGMTEGFVDFPLSIDTVEVAASIMEVKKGQYKVSLRSKNYVDVNALANVYGGGGHVRAAGCMLMGDFEDVYDRLCYTVSQYLED